MFRCAAVVRIVLVVALAASTASAQADSSLGAVLRPGTRVRVTVAGARLWGPVLALRQDSLDLGAEDGRDARTIALADVSRLEVSAGMHTNPVQATVIGAALGLALGGLAGASTDAEPSSDDCVSPIPCFGGPGMIVVGMAAGGMIGALIGQQFGRVAHESWTTVRRATGRVGVHVTPTARSGVAAVASLRF